MFPFWVIELNILKRLAIHDNFADSNCERSSLLKTHGGRKLGSITYRRQLPGWLPLEKQLQWPSIVTEIWLCSTLTKRSAPPSRT